MSERVLAVRLVEVALRETGDSADRVGENVVNILALWPRPGRPESVGSTGGVALTDHSRESDEPDRSPEFTPLLLKERVEGEVSLVLHVLERDPRQKFARFLRLLALGAVDGARGHVFGGLARHLFSGAANSGALDLGESVEDRVDVVAVSEEPLLLSAARIEALAASGLPERVRVAMKAPRDLVRPREKGRLAALRSNGHLVLELGVSS